MKERLNLNISVARACFVRCDGCYNHFGRRSNTVGTDEIITFLAFARTKGIAKVTLCGGDPLARADLMLLLDEIRRLGYSINLDTVGTPIIGDATTRFYGHDVVRRVDAAQLAQLVDLIGIPIDGASNESIALFRSGRPNLLDEQMQIMAALNACNARICINTVVHKSNIKDIPSVLELIEPFDSVEKWQLFQFAPIGPLGYRNRERYSITAEAFTRLKDQLHGIAGESRFGGRLEFKSNADRKGNYLLVDSDGLAWMPQASTTTSWDYASDENDQRIVLGDITRHEDHEAILDVVVNPGRVLPVGATRTPISRYESGGQKNFAELPGGHADIHPDNSIGTIGDSSLPRGVSRRVVCGARRPETAATSLVEMIRGHGTATAFAYPGTSELALCHAATIGGLSVINSRGDKEAVFMAAGGNFARPKSSIALLHGARGLTNALGAIADVRRSEISVLCIVGMASSASVEYLPPHAEPDLIKSASSFARAVFDLSRIDRSDVSAFDSLIAEAIATLTDPPYGPVLVGIPQDLLSATSASPSSPITSVDSLPVSTDDTDVRSAHDAINGAERPVILVDDYLLRAVDDAERLLGKIAAAYGAPVFQVAYRRGPMLFQRLCRDRVPTFVGYYEPANPCHRDLLRAADLLVTVEDRNMYPRVVGPLPSCRKIAITSNPSATRKNGYLTINDIVVSGHAVESLARLASLSSDRAPKEMSPVSWSSPRSTIGTSVSRAAVGLVRGLAGGLASVEQPVLVDDSQMLGGLVARNYTLLPPSIRLPSAF